MNKDRPFRNTKESLGQFLTVRSPLLFNYLTMRARNDAPNNAVTGSSRGSFCTSSRFRTGRGRSDRPSSPRESVRASAARACLAGRRPAGSGRSNRLSARGTGSCRCASPGRLCAHRPDALPGCWLAVPAQESDLSSRWKPSGC